MRELLIEKYSKPDGVYDGSHHNLGMDYWPLLTWKNKYGQYHRDYNLPAKVWANGEMEWFKNDKMYRYKCDKHKNN